MEFHEGGDVGLSREIQDKLGDVGSSREIQDKSAASFCMVCSLWR